MTFDTVLPLWQSIGESFLKTIRALPEEDLELKIEPSQTIGEMIWHTAEVEYMFADTYFGKPAPADVKARMERRRAEGTAGYTSVEDLADFQEASYQHIIKAMRELPEEKWNVPVESKFGNHTPLVTVSRLMHHTGSHSGMIWLIQKSHRGK